MSLKTVAEKMKAPFLPTDIDGVDALIDLALDLRWSWNHGADIVWRQLDPRLWELTYNPWVVLKTVSWDKLKRMLEDPKFRNIIDELSKAKKRELECPAWFQEKRYDKSLNCVAYFSMEYMLSEALPIYSGGLGNVAGDLLKASSDLGVPIVAIGLLYQQGYFRQIIDNDGRQQAVFPYNDPDQLPIQPLRLPNGEWLRLDIPQPGYTIWLRVWQVQVGRIKLYLLDSNDAANFPTLRGVTSELYGGGPELRLKQELILGIGGWRLLQALSLNPEVCHLNEGHAAFAILDRAKSYMEKEGVPFDVALEATRAGNLFTTHTAVPAGFDKFAPALIEQFLGPYAKMRLGLSTKELLGLGRLNPDDPKEDFNMAYLAIRGSGAINGVSRLHMQVSKDIFQPLYPRWDQADIPVGYVTNGVHMPSWDSREADELWTSSCGKSRWLGDLQNVDKEIRSASDERIWKMRNDARKTLIEFTRERLSFQLAASAAPPEKVEAARHLFDPSVLTLGFARRFATYKRPNMLLQNPDRLLSILRNPNRPIQLMIAGKAHPADKLGQELIYQWIQFIRYHNARANIVFLGDYDMSLTENLVRGVDVWINTPQRPWEACGTSGMKVLVNGGINISELDGWWVEAYKPEVGWAIGDCSEHHGDPAWTAKEANMLYDLLEHEIAPEFYTRNAEGIPTKWIARIRESMAELTPRFSANRMVREYTEKYYLNLGKSYLNRTKEKGAGAKRIVQWKKTLAEKWPFLRFGDVKVTTDREQHQFEVTIYLDDLDPNFLKAELYADNSVDQPPFVQEMQRVRPLAGDPKTYLFQASVPASRSADAYTPRLVPYFEDVAIPLEANEILWQK